MEDIFKKIELLEHSSQKAITDVWVQLSSEEYQNKVTNKKLSRIDFLRYQEHVGASAFIVEVFK